VKSSEDFLPRREPQQTRKKSERRGEPSASSSSVGKKWLP